jgi:hypothetical protein
MMQFYERYEFLMRIRGPLQITSIAIPPILLLAAYSVERILSKDLRLEFQMESSADPKPLRFNFKWLLLIPLALNIRAVADLSKDFIAINHQPPHIDTVLDALETDSLEWVQVPQNQWVFIETAIRRGYKLSPGIIPFDWKERDFPLPYYEVTADSRQPEGNTSQRSLTNGYTLFAFDETHEYARVESGRQLIPCQAYGTGGDLDVYCDTPSEGILVLQVNSWSGWKVYRDGEEVELLPGQWLSARTPAGEHEFQFRYRPWDVPLGAALSLLGIGLCVWLWFKKED